ncbi:MAG: DUF1801 domain-containing protein [Deltaproteobacteria bacterium]|nr:DUF1801 domain-containing protein [Deltaproteobacteria bacterium]
MESNTRVADFLSRLSPAEKEIITPLRKQVLQLATNVHEDVKWNALCYFKGARAFVGIMPYKKYISVIFDRGAELVDSYRVLEGKGHTMRHIKIHSLPDVAEKNVVSYVEQSYNLRWEVQVKRLLHNCNTCLVVVIPAKAGIQRCLKCFSYFL